ncbi:MAG: hypothetical protein ACRDN0_07765 [Trebonia sp.]
MNEVPAEAGLPGVSKPRPEPAGTAAETSSGASSATVAVADRLAALMAEYRAISTRAAQEKARAELEADRITTARRRSDTRRKIIIGGAILAAFREGSAPLDEVLALLRRRISAPRDRALVGQVLPIEGPSLPLEEPPSPRAGTREAGSPAQPRSRSENPRHVRPARVDVGSVAIMVPELPAPLEASLLALLESDPETAPAAP